MDLRLDLAEIILRALNERGWTQRQLADAAGMREQYVTRVIHSSQNCTVDIIGRLLFALQVKAKLQPAGFTPIGDTDRDVTFVQVVTTQDMSNGKEEIFESEAAEITYSIAVGDALAGNSAFRSTAIRSAGG
jgi:transcriptional regulator with XRE-family HTH domain